MHCILVVDEAEKAIALEAGWDHRDILIPKVRTLEGRRFDSLTFTWGALSWLIETRDQEYVFDVLHRHVIAGSYRKTVPVRIEGAHVGPPQDEVETLRQIAEGLAPKFIQPVTENCIYGCSHVHE